MAYSSFISADIGALVEFLKRSEAAIEEFDSIKQKFNDINKKLLEKWKGDGADAYKYETDHILENIGGIKDVLESINNSAIKDIRDMYSKLDDDLAEFNKNPTSE